MPTASARSRSPLLADGLLALGAAVLLGVFALAVTKIDAGPGKAAVDVVAASGAAALTKSVGGDAVLSAGDLKPGGRTAGTVTVENGGDATGSFELAQTDVLDSPGTGGGRLSTTMRLQVEDAATRRPVYSGVLGAMEARPLGYLRAGQKRTYRFTLTLPAAAPAEAFAGARVETRFDWTAETGEPPARDDRPPGVLVDAVGRIEGQRLTIGLTCDEPCSIVAVSGGAAPAVSRSLAAGKPALATVRVPRSSLAGVAITVSDPAGNRTRVRLRPAR